MEKDKSTLLIREASPGDRTVIASLLGRLFASHDPEELDLEIRQTLESPDQTFFLAFSGASPSGLAQVAIRKDYVEGADQGPAAYLEAIYVERVDRLIGIGKNLVEACENWSRLKGCPIFASDSLLENEDSRRFHLAVGFSEVSRNIHYIKKLTE